MYLIPLVPDECGVCVNHVKYFDNAKVYLSDTSQPNKVGVETRFYFRKLSPLSKHFDRLKYAHRVMVSPPMKVEIHVSKKSLIVIV